MRCATTALLLVLALAAGCDATGVNTASTEDLAATAGPEGETIFCAEVQRRTTQEECDDFEAMARGANQGTAAFNVPKSMRRGDTVSLTLVVSHRPPDPLPAATDAATPPPPEDTAAVVEPTTDPADPGTAPAEGDPPEIPTGKAVIIPPPDPGPSPKEIVAELPGETIEMAPVVGRHMAAELTGAAFKIEAKTPRSQELPPGGTATWLWDVTADRSGDGTLLMKTFVEGKLANGDLVTLHSTQTARNVTIGSNWWEELKAFLDGVPAWLASLTAIITALGALVGAWFALKARFKGGGDAEPPAD